VKVSIHRLDSSVPVPKYETAGAAGFDLAASADVSVAPGEIALIPTGLVIGVPAGHFLGIFARSSTPLRRGLMVANGVGVLDSDYCGPNDELKIQLFNLTDRPISVKAGDRLAQGILLESPRVEFVEGETSGSSRGGFGSTGQ
jgi:dUTP pyrophosphatase